MYLRAVVVQEAHEPGHRRVDDLAVRRDHESSDLT
jgi:hypothetical protein